jgi:hypothetical protein
MMDWYTPEERAAIEMRKAELTGSSFISLDAIKAALTAHFQRVMEGIDVSGEVIAIRHADEPMVTGEAAAHLAAWFAR